MADPLRYPAANIVAAYSHRWEIELDYREMQQSLPGNRLTLRSRMLEMMFHKLWGTWLACNLTLFQMPA